MDERNLNDFLARLHHEDVTESLYTDIAACMQLQEPQHELEQPTLRNMTNWTREDVQMEIQRSTELVDKCITIFRSSYDVKDYVNRDFWTAINNIKETFTSFNEAPPIIRKEIQEKIVRQLIDSSVLPILSFILDEQLQISFEHFKETKEINRDLSRVACSTSAFFLYFADTSVQFAAAVTDDDCILLKCVKMLLDCLMVPHFLKRLDQEVEDALFTGLLLSYNLVMHDDSEIIRRIRNSKLMESMRPYLFSDVERCKVITLLFMVYVANESDIKNYCSNPLVIKFLLDKLEEATNDEKKAAAGYRVNELMKALEKLSALDSNKALLADFSIVCVMKDLLEGGEKEEIRGSLQILTHLAFNEDLAKNIYNEVNELIRTQFFDHDDLDLQKAARGLMLVITEKEVVPEGGDVGGHLSIRNQSLRGHTSQTPRYDDANDASRLPAVDREQHIMISYSWDHQAKARAIRDYLERNRLKVWYDEDRMGPNLLDSMAEAVENSWMVLICYSRKYQLSQNTRLEAEYAIRCKKRIIPVKMENYEPDGWLGLLVGQKFFYDFSEEKEENYFRLFTAIKRRENNEASDDNGRQSLSGSVEDMTIVQPSEVTTLPNSDLSYLDHWNEGVVKEWFNKNNINSRPLGSLTGKGLRLLVRMRKNTPDAFYRFLLKKLTLQEVALFEEAVELL